MNNNETKNTKKIQNLQYWDKIQVVLKNWTSN